VCAPRTPAHYHPSPIADTLDICPSGRYPPPTPPWTWNHQIPPRPQQRQYATRYPYRPYRSCRSPRSSESVIFLVVWRFRHRCCTRNDDVGPSTDSQSIRPPARRRRLARPDKSKAWPRGAIPSYYAPDPFVRSAKYTPE
jgi:hypothetical protein